MIDADFVEIDTVDEEETRILFKGIQVLFSVVVY